MRTPFPHQVQAADYAVKHFGACFWMKMRTGKTFSTLMAVERMGLWPLLIVCPKSIMKVWVDEFILNDADADQIQAIDGPPGKRTKALKEPKAVNIVNYEMLQPYDVFRVQPWACIVIDESIKIANFSAKRTAYCLDYVQKRHFPEGQVRFCLSGSPASEKPIQLMAQHYFQKRNIFGYDDWEEYLRHNWHYVSEAYEWKPNDGQRHIRDLRQWNKENSFQCTMEDIGMHIPLLKRRIPFEPSQAQNKLLQAVREDATYIHPETKEIAAYIPLVRAGFELQICCGLDPFSKRMIDMRKIEHILDWHDDEDHEPCLVISEFRTGVLEAFLEFAKHKRIKVGVMVGGMSQQERDQVKSDFDSGKINVVFGQVAVVKMGLNFSRASTIFYLSNSYSLDDREQSEVRCNQMGKTEPTEIIDLVMPGTLDGALVDLLEKKSDMSSTFVQRYYEEKGWKK